MLSICVLGPVEVRHNGRLITVPAGKTSEILVRLALDVGQPVRTDRLVDDLWGEEAIHTSRNTVQSKIAKLRRAIGDPAVVVAVDGGYMLDVDPADVDAVAVVVQANEAAALFEGGDERGAAGLCASALEWFRGDVLAAAGDGDWVDQHRARIEAARLQLLETGFGARLRFGDVGEVVGELEAAVVTYPYQESLWVLLITALYASGRQADALAAYQRVRQRLADELGLEPGPQLRRVEQQVLSHDPNLDSTSRGAMVIKQTPVGNLPSLSTELIGRDSELAAITDLVANNRLVEIVGPGGIGKTAVAVAVGRALVASSSAPRGGVWLARLETAVTRDDVSDTLLAALSVTGGETALIERLKSTDAVLILDNCEHVVEFAADFAVRLLDAAPGLRILCTSQTALEVDGEMIVELEPLKLDDAIELFRLRATKQRKGINKLEIGDALQELCRSLDGLPLAIELAAARTKTLSIEEITRRLDDRFNVLQDPTSRRPERRRALKATIRWSYELLFPDDQRALWALATFAGGAPLPAIESVLAALDVPATAAIDVLSRLASRSLVIVDDDGADTVRYRLLDSIRAFALEAMSEAGLDHAALAAHAGWYANRARSSTEGVRNSEQAAHLRFAKTERANIDAALAWSTVHQPLMALSIVNGFGWAWVVLGDSRGAQRLHAALACVGVDASERDRATALLLAGWIEVSAGDIGVAERDVAAAAQLADSITDVELQARCCYYLAYVVSHRGEFQRALELTDRADSLFSELDRPWDQAANWLFAARAAISAGDRLRSAAAAEQVERWVSLVDDPWLRVRRDAALGELARLEHRFDDAVTHIGRAAETSHRLGFLQTEAYQTASLGRAQCQAGDYEAGAATLESAIAKAEATGDIRMATLARVHLGRVLRGLGHLARAREVLEAASAWHRSAGGGEQASLGDCLLAAIDLVEGVSGADERLLSILETAQVNNEAHVEVFVLDALARHAAVRGDVDAARALSARAESRMEAASHFITERDRSDAPKSRSS